MKKITVGVLFGGRSTEHEVSIITGIQVLNALNKNKYEVIPLYVDKTGKCFVGNENYYKPQTFSADKNILINSIPVSIQLDGYLIESKETFSLRKKYMKKVDVFFPAFHGRYGEDGSIQGLFEINNVAYVGCDVQASSIGMDKVISKKIAKSISIPVLPDICVTKNEWLKSSKNILKDIMDNLKFPIFVKPVRLGSSIGIKLVKNKQELEEAIDIAFFYDTKVMVEEGLVNAREVNISILGNNPYKLSCTEEPVSVGKILSFEDKYTSENGQSKGMASAKRLIPAPINHSILNRIEEYSRKFFKEIGGQGIARIDFLISKNEKEIYLNEINTMPGSVAFYLWKETNLGFDQLVDNLISLAIERKNEKDKLTASFKSNILQGYDGSKVMK